MAAYAGGSAPGVGHGVLALGDEVEEPPVDDRVDGGRPVVGEHP